MGRLGERERAWLNPAGTDSNMNHANGVIERTVTSA